MITESGYSSLSMLRFYREEGKLCKWRETEKLIGKIRDFLTADQREGLQYEKFLFFQFCLDAAAVKECLASWKVNRSQPYWMAKRALALAEVGELRGAGELLQSSLVDSRKTSLGVVSPARYQSASYESYLMYLLNVVRNCHDFERGYYATDEELKLVKEHARIKWRTDTKKMVPIKDENVITRPIEGFETFDEDFDDLLDRRSDTRRTEWSELLRAMRNEQDVLEQKQQHTRRNELRAYQCDPWSELENIRTALKIPEVSGHSLVKTRGFDIGGSTSTHHFDNGGLEHFSAISFFRLSEDIGMPFHIGNNLLEKESVILSAKAISQENFFWAAAALFRVADAKSVGSVFSRKSVQGFSTDKADNLVKSYLTALANSSDDIAVGEGRGGFGARLAQVLPEVISRICCRCSSEVKQQVFHFIHDIYSSPIRSKYRNVDVLTRRLFKSVSDLELYAFVPDILGFPCPKNSGGFENWGFINPFHFVVLDARPETAIELAIDPLVVDKMLRYATETGSGRRAWAVTSLQKLQQLDLLNGKQLEGLRETLWSVLNESGVPKETDFYQFAFLGVLRSIEDGHDSSPLFRAYVRGIAPYQDGDGGDKGKVVTGDGKSWAREIIGASEFEEGFWGKNEIFSIFQCLVVWWDSEKDKLHEREIRGLGLFSSPESRKEAFTPLLRVLSRVVGHRLSAKSAEETIDVVSRVLREMEEYGLPVLEAKLACINSESEKTTDIYSQIGEALQTGRGTIRVDAYRALIAVISGSKDLSPYPKGRGPDLLLCDCLLWCHSDAVYSTLETAWVVLTKSPERFSLEIGEAALKLLDRLFTETSYENEDVYPDFDEKLHIRRMASKLAVELFGFYKLNGSPEPEIISKWRGRSQFLDEFAEIRNLWVHIEESDD